MDLVLTGLEKTYGSVRALDGVDLDVPTGMFGLLGGNGAGKTTLMRCLTGVLRPTAGSVTADGRLISTDADRRWLKARLGYLPQELGLYPDLSPRQLLDYVGVLKGLDDRPARRDEADRLLEVVGLADVADRKVRKLSGGTKRRVGIAQALLGSPSILIVDEPTAGLDPEERIRFRTLLARLATDRTVMLSTHIVEDIAQTCRELAVMATGRVRFRGTVDELIDAAVGHTWLVRAPVGVPTPAGCAVVASVARADHVEYRVVGALPANVAAEPATPTLEDAYIRLARQHSLQRA